MRRISLKLVPVFEPISEFDGFLGAQISEGNSHRSPNHYRLRMHVANERFVLLECAW